VSIDVWSDVLCPWCYLGEQRLRTAIEHSGHAEDLEVRVHTFHLDPAAPTTVMPAVAYLAQHHGIAEDEARAMEESMAKRCAREGLRYEADRPARNTLDMLRLVHLGADHGLAAQYMHAMKNEVFGGNLAAFEHDTLVRLGEQLGIPAKKIRDVLATGRYAEAVAADRDQALGLGAKGLPYAVVGDRLGLTPGRRPSRPAAALTTLYRVLRFNPLSGIRRPF
jgi:predicted DsbA family dithiol-disulfide isomerase